MDSKKKPVKRKGKSSGSRLHTLLQISKWFIGTIGVLTLLAVIISFTHIPFNAYYNLGTANSKLIQKPDIIVIMSGSGMPSPDGLIRAWYGAEAGKKYPDAKIIIALPFNEGDSLRPLKLMAHELIIKGIDSSRIHYEPLGFNTRSQAMNIAAKHPGDKSRLSLALITSPEHMYRSVKSFKKVGFSNVGGLAAFDTPIEPEKAMDKENSKDIRIKNLSLRYNMWSYLHYELTVLREYSAIAYYKLKGWI